MSGVNNNRLNATIPAELLNTLKGMLHQIGSQLPFLVGLSPAERMSLPKININNRAFTEDAFNVLHNNVQLFPSYLNVGQLDMDLILYKQLDELATVARQLTERLEDTRTLAGSEAYTTALSVYRITEAAAVAGIPGSDTIYRQLKERFIYSPAADKGDAPTSGVGDPTTDLNAG